MAAREEEGGGGGAAGEALVALGRTTRGPPKRPRGHNGVVHLPQYVLCTTAILLLTKSSVVFVTILYSKNKAYKLS